MISVVVHGEPAWSFEDKLPWYRVGRLDVKVDPFPAYAHDAALVEAVATHCGEAFPPGSELVFHTAPHEDVSRTNGYSDREYLDHDLSVKQRPWRGHVWLGGKRIPPHPAVTRYLVAHEYGHHVEWWLERVRGLGDGELVREYMILRGLERQSASGGQWHAAAEEVFANDFRLLVAEVEPEFWPHPGIALPETAPGVVEWWAKELMAWREALFFGRESALE